MMWKKVKCFTLMELLVVVAVIALLLAVLMPSLRKAKEMAGRMVCGNHERQLATANNLYANSWDEQLCPPMMYNPDMPDAPPPGEITRYRKLNWLMNPDFRKYMALDDKQIETAGIVMPDEYFCPADKVARYDRAGFYGVLVSYAYNVTDWSGDLGCYWDDAWGSTNCRPPWLIGHKRTVIKRASEKINFTDSSDWWCNWWAADYKNAWDIIGHGTWDEYEAIGIYGPVLYRHSEGANFAFYDGHVEHLAKDKAYIAKADEDATKMWYVVSPF